MAKGMSMVFSLFSTIKVPRDASWRSLTPVTSTSTAGLSAPHFGWKDLHLSWPPPSV